MASTDFVVEQVGPVAAPAVEAAAGAEGPASAPLVEAAPVVEEVGPAAAPAVEAAVGSEGAASAPFVGRPLVEGLSAVVQALNTSAAMRLLIPNNLTETLKAIRNHVEYTAWCTDVEQNNYEKLSIIERRIVNKHVELHETLRQIQTAVDVYKHGVADVSWFSL